jgi:hypothetical protein
MLTDLADVIRNAGFTVIEQKGWKTRGHGVMSDIRTIIAHHTAGPLDGNAPSLDTVQNGRPGLDGPLAQVLLARDSTVYVIAAGLCYHAGVSQDNDYTNSHAIGIEAEATGIGTWDGADMRNYGELGEVLKEHYGATHFLGHKETCSPHGRKTDPNLDMATLRRYGLESQMPLSNTDVDRIADAVVRRNFAVNRNGGSPTVETISLKDSVEMTDSKLDDIRASLAELKGAVTHVSR